MDTERKFPTEAIDLPSNGWFYDADSPLASGKIELKYMTAREEDILTSTNLIQKGLVLDRLLKAVVVTKVDINDLLVGDKNGILMAARIMAYGKTYPSSILCRKCGAVNSVNIDLTKLNEREIVEPEEKGKNEFEFVLPKPNNTKIVFRALTHKDDEEIAKEVEGQRKIDPEVEYTQSTRLKYMIVSIDGNTDDAEIRRFVDEGLIARDASALRQEYTRVVPDVDLTFEFTCTDCDDQRRMSVPLGIDFFWPIAGV